MTRNLNIIRCCLIYIYYVHNLATCNSTTVEEKLQDYLLNRYAWPVRPVQNYTDQLDVFFRFQLTRIVDLSIKDQSITLNFLIIQEWTNYKFKWNPSEYGGITQTSLPIERVWVPDVQLFNSSLEFHLVSKVAIVYYTGLVTWQPMAIVKTLCPFRVENYPFDIQSCTLAFGSWTYPGEQLWVRLKDFPELGRNEEVANPSVGMDLSTYEPSNEWALISVPVQIVKTRYNYDPYLYLTFVFDITARRHSNFYLVNLVLPLVGLSYLCLLVFYLPADSGEKLTLCMSLLTSQITFLLLMIDRIPVTSLGVPLLGKIIIFNLLLIFLSILCTIIVLNIHHRKPSTHKLPKCVKNLCYRNRLLAILRVQPPPAADAEPNVSHITPETTKTEISQLFYSSLKGISEHAEVYPTAVAKTIKNICFVRDRLVHHDLDEKECQSWKFLAAIIDRIFLILFQLIFFTCMIFILRDAPALYDKAVAIDKTSICSM